MQPLRTKQWRQFPERLSENVDGSQQSYKMYNTGDSKSWKGYDVILAEVFGGYKGDNPMASYIQATGTDSFTNTNQSDVNKPTA